ncbi:hypothetical protein CINF_1669 [Candidatus Campylobacter infans]|uniref:Uncharacterized protein n=1 Tax=Candidatus Campylobacter infans TaxID=2561898 RepID=A0A7H9CJH6_9BACT|nr:hypothetical protein CINF_1669 [Candidatus Campylobacter infans]
MIVFSSFSAINTKKRGNASANFKKRTKNENTRNPKRAMPFSRDEKAREIF